MMIYVAIAVVFAVVYLLIKQYETRTVLIGAGLLLCLLAGDPMSAFAEFSKAMVNGGLIMAICSSMGFAFVMKFTKCDMHLVRVLSSPLKALGIFLIPATVIVTFLINTAIPSAAGCAAAVGATLIPLLIASRVHPAIAGAAVLSGTFGSMLSPGSAHNAFVSNMSNMEIVELIIRHAPYTITAGVIGAISIVVVAFVRKEWRVEVAVAGGAGAGVASENNKEEAPRANYLYATAPFIPLILLVASNMGWLGDLKFDVPAAMVIGSLYAIIITLCNPNNVTKEFFKGMGSAYGDILGIIIAAAVFTQGLKASGMIDAFIEILKTHPEIARWGGTLGPFLMGVITGSGDAAAMAFNGAVTPHAPTFGYEVPDLGMAAAISGAIGRTMSPVAGVVIVCAGLAGVSPVELVKRTAPGMICAVLFLALFML